jgi:putative ABC transport system substrate-binding protein
VKRREFFVALGGAGAWPVLVQAQSRLPVIGLLEPRSSDAVTDRIGGFRKGLKDGGFIEGDNVTVEYQWAEGQFDRLPPLAEELVRRDVALIVATNTASAMAAKAATTTIPIVFAVPEDPVGLGLVASVTRPGTNATGINFFSQEVVSKRLALMRELVPAATRFAVLANPTAFVTTQTTIREATTAAHSMGLKIDIFQASNSREINAAFATFASEPPDALFVGGDAFFQVRRSQLVNLASRYAIPATYGGREFVQAGGLMSYGSNLVEVWREIGEYASRILKGSKPTDLPVKQASKFELIINAETARMLGLTIPPNLLARADEVIE